MSILAKEADGPVDFRELGCAIQLQSPPIKVFATGSKRLSTMTEGLTLLNGSGDYISYPHGVIVILEALPKADDLNPALPFKLQGTRSTITASI